MASSSSSFERTLAKQLRLVGNDLLNVPSSVDKLLALLNDAEVLLANVEQGPSYFLQNSLLPVMKALITDSLLKHSVEGVRVSVTCCFSEVLRISAPLEPFNDDHMKVFFEFILEAFSKLSQASGQYYQKALSILETVARVKACVLMLDLKCDALVVQMFQSFWAIVRSNPADDILWAVEQIMTDILGESEDISLGLLSPLLASVLKENKDVAPSCWKLGERVITSCATKLGPVLHGAVWSSGSTVHDYSPVVASVCENEPTMEYSHADGSSQPEGYGLSGRKLVGQKIKVWWPLDETFYCGVIQSYDPFRKRHKVLYDDGDIEKLNLKNERWEFIRDDLPTEHLQGAGHPKPKASPVMVGYNTGSIKKSESLTKLPIRHIVERAEASSRLPEVEDPHFGSENVGRDESSKDESTKENAYEIRFRSKDVQPEYPSSSTPGDSTPTASPPRCIRMKFKDVQPQNTSDDSTPEGSPPTPWGLSRSGFRHP